MHPERNITLIHKNTHETKTVPVLCAYKNFITIKWDLAGPYELNIRTNILGRAPLWKAQDLEAARDIWQAMRFGEKLSGEDRKVIARVRGVGWQLKKTNCV